MPPLHVCAYSNVTPIFPIFCCFQRKASYLKKTAQILRDSYEDDIPDSVEGLCALPGVGPKMAHLTMNIAWKRQSGIGNSD